jgi:eukaryotic-like serine/threonine-protein kinase
MSDHFERIEALFDRAIEFRPEERAAFLAGACGSDTALLARVHSLLQAHEFDKGILPEEPRDEPVAGLLAEKPGDRIGHYKLLERIGEGGCGVVYMAEQEEPVRRRVALKVIKLGMDTKRVVARFEAERQALALMDHPNIAKVLDAGTTQTGRPFFVMELVRGVKITDFCDQNDLATAQRLDLVMQTCRAIQHAHQKGIIHRDIKPSNVLVTVHDGAPVPKVIDFGIAKAIEGRLTDQTLFTSFEQFVGTPAYMSPEQAQVKGLDVDTRTDIYSLGVLLYELLTGKTPFDVRELLALGLDEMRRTIREKEPLRPSTRLNLELARAETAKRGGQTPGAEHKSEGKPSPGEAPSAPSVLRQRELIRLLRGDLDWIVMKCLEKDRTRRYATANGLAMDLERHLNAEPVVARPPSNLYRFQKLVRRNRLVFSAAAAVAVALILGTAGSTWEAVRARRAERAEAHLHQEADRARAGEASQRAAAEQHLYTALLGEARAKEISGRAGQRFESLEAITRAAAIHRSTELSDAAIAALALPDLRPQKRWRVPSRWMAENLCIDDSFGMFAYRTPAGISVRRIEGNEVVGSLTIKDVPDTSNGLQVRCFDPRSRYLAANCFTDNAGWRCRVWDLARGGDLVLDLPDRAFPDFSPDGQSIALVNPDASVSEVEVASGKELNRIAGAGVLDLIRFSPDGTKLAGLAFGSPVVHIWERASGRPIGALTASYPLTFLAWSPDSSQIAAGGIPGSIGLWDVQSGRQRANLEGHESRVVGLTFSHQGNLMVSRSWDRTLRLWDVARGRPVVVYRTLDTQLHFSPDDRALAFTIGADTVSMLEVAHSTGYRRLPGEQDPARSWYGELSPDGHWMAVGKMTGIVFWDVFTGKKLGSIPAHECRSVHFHIDEDLGLVGCTADGLFRWPLRIESTAHGAFLRVDPPRILATHDIFRYSALARDGKRIVASKADGADPLVLDLADLTRGVALRDHPGADSVAMAPSGRWAATGTWKGTGVTVYEAATGQIVRELPVSGSASVAFSPDEKWLATADIAEVKLWKAGSWDPGPQSLPGDRVAETSPLAFSPDGQLLARVSTTSEIQLVKVPSCETVATLRLPMFAQLSSLAFSADGTKLIAVEWRGDVDIWDLPVIRAELKKLNLDWDLPEFKVPPQGSPAGPVVLGVDGTPFSKEELAQTIPPRDPSAATNLLDLTDSYNAPLTESWYSAKEEQNNLSELPRGIQTLGGVQFDLRGLIQIGVNATNGLFYPNRVDDIPVRRQCRRLHLLHGAILAAGARPGDELGSYIFHYADGRQIELPIVTGKDMADWWSQPGEPEMGSIIAWSGHNRAASEAGRAIRLFKTTWENPYPQVPIRLVDFVSDKPTPGQPFLVAITAEP